MRTDGQLTSGQFFDEFTFDGLAGHELLIALSSPGF